MAVKDIDKTENETVDPPSAEEQAWFARELSLIKEELARIEATAQQSGGGFDWEDNRSKRFDRGPNEPAEASDTSDDRAEDAIASFREEMRAEFAALHNALRNLLYQETTDLRMRLARAETRLAAEQRYILSPAKPLRRS